MATKAKPRSSTAHLAGPPLIEDIEPQLATLVDRPPSVGQWVYEVKFDGYRMLARI
jgi:bifunctional non-homologous end joining protein LigD